MLPVNVHYISKYVLLVAIWHTEGTEFRDFSSSKFGQQFNRVFLLSLSADGSLELGPKVFYEIRLLFN